MTNLRVLDLFSGIGGFALGLKKAGGFRTVGYCEIDPYCQRVLQARMRDGSLDTAPVCNDIRRLDGKPWAGRVDLICGGFPCQDISVAGRGAGLDGARSGLWFELGRLVREVRPRYVLVENVAALLHRGLERVLGDLAESGYDAEWDVIPACAVGANHIRERVWILAYPEHPRRRPIGSRGRFLEWENLRVQAQREEGSGWPGERGTALANAPEAGRQNLQGGAAGAELPGLGASCSAGWWDAEPSVGRVADGVPKRLDRIGALGNSIVPFIVEWIGRRIKEANQ